jgi:predicted AlkP superfamily phosphohydrolase/phosphomutase
VAGREPQGCVDPADYDSLRDELIERLEALPGPDGIPLGTRVHRPEDLWAERLGIAPDLVVYFGNLSWRSNGSIGHGSCFTFDNDTGPDDANHRHSGMCIMSGPGVREEGRQDLDILDIAPTVLQLYGLPVPAGLRGRVTGLMPEDDPVRG